MRNLALGFIGLAATAAIGWIGHSWASTANGDGNIGKATVSVTAPHRNAQLALHLWYPAAAGGVATLVGDNPLFVGVPARLDASVAPGRHPLILLSHGSGGNAENLAWIATPLAEAGFIVAAPNHPGTTSRDSRQADTMKVWNRPRDLTAIIDALLKDPKWSGSIDPARIGALGFSLGGETVLAAAGARLDAAAFARYCDAIKEVPGMPSDCAWLKKGGIDLHAIDPVPFNAGYGDARVKAIVAVDPAGAQAYNSASLKAIGVPVTIINLGRAATILPAIAAADVAATIPHAAYETVADAVHFSFLGTCKPGGAEMLKSEGEGDPLCTDGGGRPRTALHAEIAALIGAAFARSLPTP